METANKPQHINKPQFIKKPEHLAGSGNVTHALAEEARGGGGRQGTPAERGAARRHLALRAENEKRLAAYLRVSRTALVCEAKKMLSCRAAAEDAVQDAAVKALQTTNQFDSSRAADPDRGFRAWFHQILTNVCIDQKRASSRRIATVPFASFPDIVIEEASVDPAPEVWEQVMRRRAALHGEFGKASVTDIMREVWHLDPLYDALLSRYTIEDVLGVFENLCLTDQHILILCIIDGKEEVDAATEMKCSAGLVRSRLSTAIQRLRSGVRLLDMANAAP